MKRHILPLLAAVVAAPAAAQVTEADLIRETIKGAVHNLRWEPAGYCVYRKNSGYRVQSKFFNWVPTLVVGIHNGRNPWNLGRLLGAPVHYLGELANDVTSPYRLGSGGEAAPTGTYRRGLIYRDAEVYGYPWWSSILQLLNATLFAGAMDSRGFGEPFTGPTVPREFTDYVRSLGVDPAAVFDMAPDTDAIGDAVATVEDLSEYAGLLSGSPPLVVPQLMAEVIGNMPRICGCADTDPGVPHMVTALNPEWRLGFTEAARWQSVALGYGNVGTFGSLYPRTGWLIQTDERRAAMTFAHRTIHVVERHRQAPHVYKSTRAAWRNDPWHDLGRIRHGLFPPAVPGDDRTARWQRIYPKPDPKARTFGSESSARFPMSKDGRYLWILWKPTVCCYRPSSSQYRRFYRWEQTPKMLLDIAFRNVDKRRDFLKH